ncbi:hypothetical protein ACFQX6_26150 [Streptosporangium lutulentum]
MTGSDATSRASRRTSSTRCSSSRTPSWSPPSTPPTPVTSSPRWRRARTSSWRSLCTTAEDCAAIIEAAGRSTGQLIVTFNYRYSPRNSAVRR